MDVRINMPAKAPGKVRQQMSDAQMARLLTLAGEIGAIVRRDQAALAA